MDSCRSRVGVGFSLLAWVLLGGSACSTGVEGGAGLTFGTSPDPTSEVPDPTSSDTVSDTDPGTGEGTGDGSGSSTDDPSGTGPSPSCNPGATEACYGGAEGTEGVGPCSAGTRTCGDDGTWGSCEGEVLPEDEACNGQDDDCDGTVDNGNPGGGASCKTDQPGACATGTQSCEGGALVCTATPSAEVCDDGVDNDCDGTVDNGCAANDCDPLNPADVCGAGTHCHPTPSGGQCRGETGFNPEFDVCADNNYCMPSFSCFDTPGSTHTYCLQWCRTSDDCNTNSFYCDLNTDEDLFAGGEQWGFCWDGIG